MNPLDIHLKFLDEATATKLLLENSIWVKFNDQNIDASGYLTDVIGSIYKPTGVMLAGKDGSQYPELTDIGGWHVNMRGELPEALAQYKITVTGTPYRIWD